MFLNPKARHRMEKSTKSPSSRRRLDHRRGKLSHVREMAHEHLSNRNERLHFIASALFPPTASLSGPLQRHNTKAGAPLSDRTLGAPKMPPAHHSGSAQPVLHMTPSSWALGSRAKTASTQPELETPQNRSPARPS